MKLSKNLIFACSQILPNKVQKETRHSVEVPLHIFELKVAQVLLNIFQEFKKKSSCGRVRLTKFLKADSQTAECPDLFNNFEGTF